MRKGISGWSGVWTFTTIIAAPGVPQLASPSSGATNVPLPVVLSWNASANAATYAVQVSTDAAFGSTVTAQIGLTGTSASISGLGNSATYYWRVGAKDAGGVSGWSGGWSFTTIIAVPGVPEQVSPADNATNVLLPVVLSWNTSANVATYAVQVSTDAAFGTTVTAQIGLTGTSASISGLGNSATYYWRVGAKDAGGVSGWSGGWSFTTIVAAPGVPVLASPSNGAGNQPVSLSLSWNASTNAASYAVQVSMDVTFGSTVTAQIGLTGTLAAVSGLVNNATYYWRVGAKDAGGVSGWSGVWSFTTIIAAPGVPVLASPSNGAGNQPVSLSLSWNTSTNAATYAVQVSTDAAFGSTVTAQIGLTGTMASISGLGNSATYYWRVGAKDAGGVSGWSGAWSFTTVIALPDVPQLSSPASGAIAQPVTLSLGWSTSARATSYSVEVSTDAGFGSFVANQSDLTATVFGLSGLGNNVTYFWKVSAANAGGASAWSGSWSFTTLVNFSLPVNAGWNTISFNVRHADSCTDSIINVPAGPDGFILVKSVTGRVYIPTMDIIDPGMDTLHTGQGYQIFASAEDTIKDRGTVIDAVTTPISLMTGWNLIAYLPQESQPITGELSGITSQILIVKNNAGEVYWPDYGINNIGTMYVGQGYFAYMKSAATLTYAIAKRVANAGRLLSLPTPRHYGKHANTGNNASVLATRVLFGNQAAPDSCEIGAFDGSGNLVGSGTVIHGLAAFPVWGTNTQTKRKDGLGASEKITFKLWNKTGEYPVTFQTNDGSAVSYAAQAVFLGSLSVPEGALIREFNLARVYPNPFRGFVRVAFDVPTINGVAEHDIEINIFNMKGIVVHQLARGKYAAGHYVVSWSGESSGSAMVGSSVYVIQMKAANFDKRLKLVKVQ